MRMRVVGESSKGGFLPLVSFGGLDRIQEMATSFQPPL